MFMRQRDSLGEEKSFSHSIPECQRSEQYNWREKEMALT